MVPDYSNKLVIHDTNITKLCGSFPYLETFHCLDLRNNNISVICKSFTEQFYYSGTPSNKINTNNVHLQEIFFSGNPYHCDCDMTWMIPWLNNFTTPSKEHVIVDYRDLKCQSGMMKGKPIYTLNELDMGCFSRWTLEEKVGLGIGTAVFLLIILLLVSALLKRSREVKFFMNYYLKLDTVPKDDKDENVDNIQYDAFFCYR